VIYKTRSGQTGDIDYQNYLPLHIQHIKCGAPGTDNTQCLLLPSKINYSNKLVISYKLITVP
jgi:hypothetical protein